MSMPVVTTEINSELILLVFGRAGRKSAGEGGNAGPSKFPDTEPLAFRAKMSFNASMERWVILIRNRRVQL